MRLQASAWTGWLRAICKRHKCMVPQEEAAYKLLKVTRQQFGKGGVPYITTHDGRTIRYPDPDIKVCKSRSPWTSESATA